MAEDTHQHDRDRAAEVQLFPGDPQQCVRVVEVGVDVAGAALGGTVVSIFADDGASDSMAGTLPECTQREQEFTT